MATKFYLKFLDQNQKQQTVLIETAQFTIGRTPDNDLQISHNNLSRQHARIERFGDVFVLSDLHSSNGTILNNQTLTEPVALKHNDQILLGQAVLLTVESVDNQTTDFSTNQFEAQSKFSVDNFLYPSTNRSAPKAFWQNIFFVAPLLGATVAALIIVMLLVFGNSNRNAKTQVSQTNEDVAETDDENGLVKPKIERSAVTDEEGSKPNIASQRSANLSENAASIESANNTINNAIDENAKTEKLARQFLRNISNDQNPILIAKQIAAINVKLKSYQNSSTVRENLRAAQRGVTNFEQLAQTHNLKSKFLIAAALAKLDQTRGDPSGTAAAIAPDLRKYGNVLGLELANDCLLVVAAYSENGSPLAMRDKVANLAKQTPGASVTTIRTIWFLHDNQKISEPAYDFALRFLAIGTMLEESAK